MCSRRRDRKRDGVNVLTNVYIFQLSVENTCVYCIFTVTISSASASISSSFLCVCVCVCLMRKESKHLNFLALPLPFLPTFVIFAAALRLFPFLPCLSFSLCVFLSLCRSCDCFIFIGYSPYTADLL